MRKTSIKTIRTFIILPLLITMLAGCSPGNSDLPKPASSNGSLLSKCIELAGIVAELSGSEAYISAVGLPQEYKEALTSIEHIDYENPERTLMLTISGKALETYLAANQLDISAVSDTILESIKARAFAAIPSHINSLQSSGVVVASSVLTSGAAFRSDEKIEGMAYIVLQYKGNAGIFVMLKEAEDDIVTASASYVYMDDDMILKIEENRLSEYFKENLDISDVSVREIK